MSYLSKKTIAESKFFLKKKGKKEDRKRVQHTNLYGRLRTRLGKHEIHKNFQMMFTGNSSIPTRIEKILESQSHIW